MERLSDYWQEDAEISRVLPGSIAEELGIEKGDRVLELNGTRVIDVFDYRLREKEENILLLVQSRNGELIEYEIEKDEDEELGLEFENPLLSHCESCDNKCIFCFIDQLPPGLRQSLYFKDDDSRLSFLTGNYVTLTNMSDAELNRIISYHFSPLNISVHTTDPRLRRKMMGNKDAGQLMERLKRIISAGIQVNCQFVLCHGINDGEALDRSLSDLYELGDGVLSIAAVPVGLSRWRKENKLYRLEPFSPEAAAAVVEQTRKWQQRFLEKSGRRVFYASDEFYLLAGASLPDPDDYEGFPQLENGVGMASLFLDEIDEVLNHKLPADIPYSRDIRVRGRKGPERVHIATGMLAAPLIEKMRSACEDHYDLEIVIHPIVNRLFGERITVSGLLTGQDIAEQLNGKIKNDETLLICDSMLRGDENIFLDDWSLEKLSETLDCRICACAESGRAFMSALTALRKERVN